MFWLLSATKLMTAVAALQCVERGLILLDEDITRVLPEWKDPFILEGFDKGSGKPVSKESSEQDHLEERFQCQKPSVQT